MCACIPPFPFCLLHGRPIISRPGLPVCMYSYDGSCRLIELSSFQFDTEISRKRPDEKSWWLNIEKHAKALLSRASRRFVSDGGGAADLWEPLFVVCSLPIVGFRCRRRAVPPSVQVSGIGYEYQKRTVENMRIWRTWWKIDTHQRDCDVISFRLSESTIAVGKLFSTLPRNLLGPRHRHVA